MKSKVIHLYGLPCSGKSTIGKKLSSMLNAVMLDGDEVRSELNSDLDFSKESRIENLRRLGALSNLLTKQGFTVVICTVAPYTECRDIVEQHVENYSSVLINTPHDVCIYRDTKGMYRKAMDGEIKNFTGIDGTFEIGTPHVTVELDTLEKQVEYILQKLNYRTKNGEFKDDFS